MQDDVSLLSDEQLVLLAGEAAFERGVAYFRRATEVQDYLKIAELCIAYGAWEQLELWLARMSASSGQPSSCRC